MMAVFIVSVFTKIAERVDLANVGELGVLVRCFGKGKSPLG